MKSRMKPNCAVAQDLELLKQDVKKMQKQPKQRKHRPEWSKRGAR